MRINNIKIHLVAIAAICTVITVTFFLMGGDQTPKGPPTRGNRYIQIDSATWGRDCDPYVVEALKKWSPLQKPPTPRPRSAVNNNALPAVKAACNDKLTCRFIATSDWVGDEPLASCFKRIVIRYRCFAYDPLTVIDAGQNDAVSIDCEHPVTPKPTAKPQ